MINPKIRLEAVRRCLEAVAKRILITCANAFAKAYVLLLPKDPSGSTAGGGGASGASPTEIETGVQEPPPPVAMPAENI